MSFVGAAVALANLAVLSAVMFVSGHDATVVAVFLVYSAGAGVGAALAMAGAQTRALDRLSATATRLATGNLEAAEELLTEALGYFTSAQNVIRQAECLEIMGEISERRPDIETANQLASELRKEDFKPFVVRLN